jgi:hypothetical protein
MPENEKITALHKSSSSKLDKKFTKQDLQEIVNAANVKKAEQLFSPETIKDTTARLKEIGDEAVAKFKCIAVYGPVKSKQRAQEKVVNDYGGDWYDLKDVIRMTLILSSEEDLKALVEHLEKKCRPSNNLGLIKKEFKKATESPCGYSGLNCVVLLGNQRPAEIQANVPRVMYGQFSPEVFEQIVGKETATKIQSKYVVPGGLGHLLYEIYRVRPKEKVGLQAATVSTDYFNYLRGKPDPAKLAALQKAITDIQATKEWQDALKAH